MCGIYSTCSMQPQGGAIITIITSTASTAQPYRTKITDSYDRASTIETINKTITISP